MSAGFDRVRPIAWTGEGLELLDQRLLPGEERYLFCQDVAAVAAAIRDMVVRGAPAIGIAAAYGVVLAARARYAASPDNWRAPFAEDLARLAASRPTAVNLHWALARLQPLVEGLQGDPEPVLLAEAERIHAEDLAANRHMGELGAAFIEGPTAVLTHCNTGSLATGGYGTALGVIRSAWAEGKLSRVYADETRPWLQGARLTAWELGQDEIPVCLLADAAAPALMRQGEVSWVIVGADRITANGDVANKIGTYGLALAARAHGLRFMVVAPTSTIDMDLASGESIPIESRPAEEVLQLGGRPVAAAGAEAWNPVFDVTPAEYVDVLVTERGVVERPNAERMAALLARG